jgi:drug/metabolite transporter (DMT)-like permease
MSTRWLGLLVIYVIWGSTYLAIAIMVETVPPLLGSGARFFLAGCVFALWRGVRVSRAELAGCALVGCLLLLGGNGLVAVGEDLGVPSGLAALVIASIPLWVVVLRSAAGDGVRRATIGWVVLGFGGVALLLLPGDRPEGASLGGLLVLVAAALCWASGSFASGRVALPQDPIRATAVQMLCGGGAMLTIALLAGEGGQVDPGAISGRSLAAFAYLVTAGSLVAFTTYVWLLRTAPLSLVATYAYVNPVVAIALGALVLDEQITGLMLVAAAVVIVSVAGTIRREHGGGPPATTRGDAPGRAPTRQLATAPPSR